MLVYFHAFQNPVIVRKVVMESVVDVFCVCRYPDVIILVIWHHVICVGNGHSKSTFKKKAQQWLCSDCQA